MNNLILIIEDDEDEQFVFKSKLLKSGIAADVCVAFDGPSGLLFIKDNPVKVVFLDYKLPGMDGMKVLKKIREKDADLPVIMLTGQDDDRTIVELLQAGATDYIAKNSLTPDTLRISIENSQLIYQMRKEKTAAEMSLRSSEARLAEAQQIALIGNWEYTIDTGFIYLSDEARRILRYPAEYRFFPYDLFMRCIHSRDIPRVKGWLKEILEVTDSAINFRMRAFDEGFTHVHIKQRRTSKDCITGTIQDVTILKNALENAQKANIKRKATSIVFTTGISIFLISEALLDPFVDAAFQTSIFIAISCKGGIALFLKPLETFLEKIMLTKMAVPA